uniref:NADH-ubiquinone oxidoreductase chain 2 n=1 Tax=Empoascanara circumscripta TaxID=3057150 RepID=A0AA51NHN0_9HEMI|nr:NADH dehydrogenase subunit 2 [Empoascanara circumscripta]WMQ52387.1 NADH dehydrogenase subunit 2 [Empoascanara circumscripta]
MKMNYSKVFFLSFMIVGVMICLCSNNWLLIWAGLELSLITLLPLMQNNLMITSESMMKYFLVQSISSGLLIFGLMILLTNIKPNYLIVTLSILMKMGVAPFHSWLISVVEPIQSLPLILMLTVSKISPLMILSFMQVSISIIILITLITGSIMGLNQSAVKKLIAYSSIFNMGLITMAIKNNFIWSFYLMMYSILIIMLVWMMSKLNSIYTNQIIINEQMTENKYALWMNLLSLGGMPPLMGFTIKLVIIEFSISKMMILNLIVMIVMSTLVMFFYMRMAYLTLMFFLYYPKWSMFKTSKISSLVIMLNLMLTPLILMIKNLN